MSFPPKKATRSGGFAATTWVLLALVVTGCGRGSRDFKAGKRAELIQDYDTALVHYERALQADPKNIEYRLKATRMRFEAGQYHVRLGHQARERGDLRLALTEYQKALAIDPSSAIARQEVARTLELLAEREAAPGAQPPALPKTELLDKPPQLKPLSREPINIKLTQDARQVYEAIGKLAGVTVIFDSEYRPQRIATELTNVTLEQALDVVALQSKTFWKPVAPNIIFVAPDTPPKRKDYEEYVVRTFYLANTVTPQDLTEIATMLRQVLEMRRIQQVNALNALVVRETPDKMAVVEKILADVDKAKPEVVVQVAVLQARRDRARDLGILPGSSTVLSPTPRPDIANQQGQVRLDELRRLSTADYSLTLPGAVATALITDSTTKVLQNPEIRIVDGQSAKLNIGDRVPVATGSFQAGVGVGGTQGSIVSPLVNTQFQFQDVGVNIDLTPRVHENRDVSLKVTIEVSAVTGQVNIGGINQPVISQRKITQDIRLREGEVSILGGLIDRTESRSLSGWPGLSRIPFLRYFFSDEKVETAESEVLIVLTPHIVRAPEITAENLRSLATGTDQVFKVLPADTYSGPTQTPAPPGAVPPTVPAEAPAGAAVAPTVAAARLRFEPTTVTLQPGQTSIVGIVIENVRDLFSIPMLLQYDPKVIAIEEVRHGGFLSGGTQEIAIVQRVDAERGQAIISATRQPNTSGVSGSGTLVGIVVRGVAAGSSAIRIVQVNARNSQGITLPLVTGEASVQVQ
jgi:general secretion pathway protein D